MKIKKEILDKINNPISRTRIAGSLKVGEQSIYGHIKKNKTNGRLTKMDALLAISEEAGCTIADVLCSLETVSS